MNFINWYPVTLDTCGETRMNLVSLKHHCRLHPTDYQSLRALVVGRKRHERHLSRRRMLERIQQLPVDSRMRRRMERRFKRRYGA